MSRHDGFRRPPSFPPTDRIAEKDGLQMKTNLSAIRAGCLALVFLFAPTAFADVCSVPSAPHPAIQAAVDDAGCTEIVLAARVFAESVTVSRTVLLRVGSSATTVIEGQVTVTGDTTVLSLQDLQVDGGGCSYSALEVAGGAQVTSQQDVVVTNGPEESVPSSREAESVPACECRLLAASMPVVTCIHHSPGASAQQTSPLG
ncbi:MAG: hypothetical protein ACC742_12540 [Thermoanaerobaculales bacterium]